MAKNPSAGASAEHLAADLSHSADDHAAFALTPDWFQERLLEWATNDPDFRLKLLRFVDVLPTLRTASSVADHVRQYFRESTPGLIRAASSLGSSAPFRPILSRAVREGVFAMANRFIAGATPDAAISSLQQLANENVGWTVDLLGEATLSEAEADAYRTRYLELLKTLLANQDAISPAGEIWDSVPAVNISVKLSALCPHFEPAAPEYVSEIVGRNVRGLLSLASENGSFINFDMEQFRYKDLVHGAVEDLLLDSEFDDFPHVGVVVQAYLRDAQDDLRRIHSIAKQRGTPVTVRLVRGAYWDEERTIANQTGWQVPVFEEKADTDDSFRRCTDELLEAWPDLQPAFGTHNPNSIAYVMLKARERRLKETDLEFQTLFGMAEGLRGEVAGRGYRTRVYLPVGEIIPGMAYLVRRLLENTSNQAWFNAGVARASAAGNESHGPTKASATAERRFENASPARFFDSKVRDQMKVALREARNSFGVKIPLVIDGHGITDREHSVVRYPADPDQIVGYAAKATATDAEAAVSSAARAWSQWRDLGARNRGEILRRCAKAMEEQRFELAATMAFECGKPWAEADGDVIEAVDFLRYYADQGELLATPRSTGEVSGEENRYFHESRGVAAIISPWNFPLAIITGMAAGALAGGNPVILKPATQSPIVAFRLMEALHKAGVPPAIVNFLPGSGSEVGQALVEHPGVATIAFTGSSETGLKIVELASRTRPEQQSIKRVVAEMGGKKRHYHR